MRYDNAVNKMVHGWNDTLSWGKFKGSEIGALIEDKPIMKMKTEWIKNTLRKQRNFSNNLDEEINKLMERGIITQTGFDWFEVDFMEWSINVAQNIVLTNDLMREHFGFKMTGGSFDE